MNRRWPRNGPNDPEDFVDRDTETQSALPAIHLRASVTQWLVPALRNSFARGLAGANFDAALHRARVRFEQVNHDLGDIIGRTLPTGSDAGATEGGLDAAGQDVTGANIVVAQVEHHGLAEASQAELRGIVGSASGKGVFRGEAADVDDVSSSPALDAWQGGVHAIERAAQVGLNDGVPLIGRHAIHGTEDADAGVVYEDINPAEFLLGHSHQALHLRIVAHIGCDALHALAGFLPQRFKRLINVPLLAGTDYHLGALIEQPFSNSVADSARRSGNDRYFIFDIRVHGFLRCPAAT